MAKVPNIFFEPLGDTYVAQFYGNLNFGDSPYLYAGRFQGPGDIYRTLLLFDLSSPRLSSDLIPPGVTIKINEAFLRLTIYRNLIPEGLSNLLTAYQLLSPWTENTVTWNTQPNFNAPAPVYSAPVSSGLGTIEFNLTNLVRGWFDGGAVNVGVLITGDEFTNNLVGFYSKQFPDTTLWPRLYVNWT